MNSAKTLPGSLRSPSAALGVLACCLGLGILGCSTQVVERQPPDPLSGPPDVSVAVNPTSATVGLGGVIHFAATVTGPGTASTMVFWSVDESSAGGTIGTDGTYTAPFSPGTFHVTAIAQANGADSARATITVNSTGGSEAPTIGTVTPPMALPGQAIDIEGTYFSAPLTVQFNGTAATVSYFTENQILTSVPPGASSGPLTVTTARGTATYPSFTVLPPVPTLSGFSPDHGVPGDRITLTGTDLRTTQSVRFTPVTQPDQGAEATFQVSDDAHVVASVPSNAIPGPTTITIRTLGGALTTSGFTVD